MIVRHIVEKSYEYDEAGHVTRETITTTEEHDDNFYGSGWWPQWQMPPQITCLIPEDTMYLEGELKVELGD